MKRKDPRVGRVWDGYVNNAYCGSKDPESLEKFAKFVPDPSTRQQQWTSKRVLRQCGHRVFHSCTRWSWGGIVCDASFEGRDPKSEVKPKGKTSTFIIHQHSFHIVPNTSNYRNIESMPYQNVMGLQFSSFWFIWIYSCKTKKVNIWCSSMLNESLT